jgi:hypothetical protein
MMITPLQTQMIIKIARSEFTTVNGAVPKSLTDIGWVWADMIIEDSEDKGVFTNLLKNNLAKHCGNKGRDASVTLTEDGFKVFQNMMEGC